MSIFKLLFFFALALLAAIALFIGAVTLLTSLQNGAITVTYTVDGKPFDETVRRAVDGDRFWRMLALWSGLPLLLGAAVMWLSVRKLKGR
jgi:hypothetical protein